MSRISRRPSPAMVVALMALFSSLGGVSYGLAAGSIDSRELKNNNVGSRDLRNNDTRTQDVRNNNLTGRDLKDNAVTGADVLESSLGVVPSATRATTAETAETANSVAAPEAYRQVDTPGNPTFGAGCHHFIAPGGDIYERASFYKDQESVVHFKGVVECTEVSNLMFELPPGYRPANGKLKEFVVVSTGDDEVDRLQIYGAGVNPGIPAGAVSPIVTGPGTTRAVVLDGVSFRAEG